MEKLNTLYNLIKKWEKEVQASNNPQVIEITKKMIANTKKIYVENGGKRKI